MFKAQGISHDRRGFVRIGRRIDPGVAKIAGIAKLWSRCKPVDSGCVEFQGFRHIEGYGELSFQGRSWRAHVLMYTLVNGPVPAGMVVMHKCDNPPCCNPDHLEVGTRADNNKDMARKGRGKYQKATACKHGHEFTPENTRIRPDGFRTCLTCARLRQQRGYAPLPKVYSDVGSAPRMRAHRARKKLLQQQPDSL